MYSAMKPPTFWHLIPPSFLNYANAFLILTEKWESRPVSSQTLASTTLRSVYSKQTIFVFVNNSKHIARIVTFR